MTRPDDAAARRVPSAPDAGPEPSDGPLTTEHQKLMDYAVARGWPISPEGVFGLCAYYDQLRRENPVRAARPAPSEVAMAERAVVEAALEESANDMRLLSLQVLPDFESVEADHLHDLATKRRDACAALAALKAKEEAKGDYA